MCPMFQEKEGNVCSETLYGVFPSIALSGPLVLRTSEMPFTEVPIPRKLAATADECSIITDQMASTLYVQHGR